MLPLWLSGRDRPPYSVALPGGQLLVGFSPLSGGNTLDLPQNSQGGNLKLEGLFCGEKRKKNMEVNSNLHLLDSLEGEELNSFQGGIFSCTEFEALFCA